MLCAAAGRRSRGRASAGESLFQGQPGLLLRLHQRLLRRDLLVERVLHPLFDDAVLAPVPQEGPQPRPFESGYVEDEIGVPAPRVHL